MTGLRTPRSALRRHARDRVVVSSPPTADITAALRTLEPPLTNVIGRGLSGRERRVALRRSGGPPTLADLRRTTTSRITRPVVIVIVVRSSMPAAAVDTAYARLQGPPRQVRLSRLVLPTFDRAATARGAVTLDGGVVTVARIALDGIGPRSGRPSLTRAILPACPVPVTHGRSVTLLNRKCNPLSRCSRRPPILREYRDKALPGNSDPQAVDSVSAGQSGNAGRSPRVIHTMCTRCAHLYPPVSTGCPEARPPLWLRA